MRIRRNPWLPTLVAAAVLVTPIIHAQETTSSVEAAAPAATADAGSTGSATSAAESFKLKVGDQLLYRTQGTVAMKGAGPGQEQSENMDLSTSITVLQQEGNVYTLYASLTATEETTGGKTQTPGPRFTFEMPATGAVDGADFEKAGLSSAAFPTFSVETLFTAPAKDGETSVTLPLPITNQPAGGIATVSTEGQNIKTVTNVSQDGKPVMTRETVFSKEKGVTESISTSVTLSVSARNTPITFSIQDKTELENQTTLAAADVEKLRADVEMAIPISAKLRTLNANSAEGMKTVLDEMTKYLQQYPNGEFAFMFNELKTQLVSVVERTTNWEKIKVGEVAPDFSATTIDNKPIKLSDYKGKVVLLDFWATWCGPCIMELPNVKKLYEANKDKGFAIIGISADEDIADLQKLVEDENLQWPQIFDGGENGGKVQEVYGVMKYPTTVLVDKEGKIAAVDVRGEEMSAAVEKLLGGN